MSDAQPEAITKKDVLGLLNELKAEPEAQSEADKERARRVARWQAKVRSVAELFVELGGPDGPAQEAYEAAVSLGALMGDGSTAIGNIADSKLVKGEEKPKPTRAPRRTKAQMEEARKAEAGEVAEDAAPPASQASKPEESFDEYAARQEAERKAATSSIPVRSGPPSASDPRGEIDPNEGF